MTWTDDISGHPRRRRRQLKSAERPTRDFPKPVPTFGYDALAFLPGSPPPLPPHRRPAPEASDDMEFMGENEQSKRYHPETEHGQESEDSKNDQDRPDEHTARARSRHRELAAKNVNPASLRRTAGLMLVTHGSFRWCHDRTTRLRSVQREVADI